MANHDLTRSRINKHDCFNTQLKTISDEIKYHQDSFIGKTVFCGCNDGRKSNFWRYFSKNFKELGLKKLICTSYSPNGKGYKLEMINDSEVALTYLQGTGDFFSPECLMLLSECDIFVSNVPFSRFKDIFCTLQEYRKLFLIIGTINCATYKDIFPYFQRNEVWLGKSIQSGGRHFNIPDYYPIETSSGGVEKTGERYIRVKGVRWFTNLDFKERYMPNNIGCKYNPELYKMYDNCNAINVDSLKDIPVYDGVIGVPITILDHINPNTMKIHGFRKGEDGKDLRVNGEIKYCRVLMSWIKTN